MGFKEFVCELLSCDAKLKFKLSALQNENKLFKNGEVIANESLSKCIVEKQEMDSALETCEVALEACKNTESEWEKYWNNRYPKQDISYRRQEYDKEYQVDVRNYFQPNDFHIPAFSFASSDVLALEALKWVKANIEYKPDKSEYGMDEFWAYPYQTLGHKKGDCEDGAILLANILLKSGVPYWRIRLNAGSVNGGGHAYLTYCRETDNEFVVLDWCYWPNDSPMKDRKLHKNEQNYDDQAKNWGIWFSWNQKYSFGAMQTMSGMPGDFVNSRRTSNAEKQVR